ncbi:MAG TPA: STAS domain-containing protein [Anaerolineae bacterium]|nr:STAS domain-containing protein [Anaerolineae bacterium]
MIAKPLETSVRYRPDAVVIDLYGDIDAFAEDALHAAYAEADKKNLPTVLLNFGDVDYINSIGIALIVSLLAQARKAGRRLLASGLSDHYKEIFQITRLADFITIFPNETSALQGF